MKRALTIMGAAAIALAGCGSDDETSDTASAAGTATATAEVTADASAGVDVAGAWARQSAMGQTLGAVYMTLTSAATDRLVAVSVPVEVAGEAQIHEVVPAETSGEASGDMSGMETGEMVSASDTMTGSEMSGMGEMVMRELEGGLPLPAGEPVMLQPGGYHIMLIDLVEPLAVGDTFDVTLDFETAESVTLTVEVAESAP